MAETVTVRLEESTRRRLAAVARRRRRTPSAIMRTAIEAWLASEDGSGTGPTPFEAMADLVGCVRGGDPKRSTRGAAGIAAKLRARTELPRR